MNYIYIPLFGFFLIAWIDFLIFFQSGPTFNRPLRIIETKTKGGLIRYRVQQKDWFGIWISCYSPDCYGLIVTEFDSLDKAEKFVQAEMKYRKTIEDSKITSNREIRRY